MDKKKYIINVFDKDITIIQREDGKFEIPKELNFGTDLKPAMELICLARKPISENSIADNVLKWGTGAININESRISHNEETKTTNRKANQGYTWNSENSGLRNNPNNIASADEKGRFPANLIHDGSDEVEELFPNVGKSSGGSGEKSRKTAPNGIYGNYKEGHISDGLGGYGDKGSASRFFYCAKTSTKERNMGLNDFEEKNYSHDGRSKHVDNAYQRHDSKSKNNHPTVKPIRLMSYLVKMITPPNGTVLDPFMGSGSTGIASKLNGFDFVGCELDDEYIKIAESRINSFEKYEEFLTDEEKKTIVNSSNKKMRKIF